jgi:Flp pilus assembly protein TadG
VRRIHSRQPVPQDPARDGLWADRAGNAILEFAFLAPAFIALILSILHTALIYLAQEGLQTAVEAASRLVATGSAQTLAITVNGVTHTGMSAAEFKNAICNGVTATDSRTGTSVTYAKALPPFLDCSRLAVNVAVVPANCTNPSLAAPTYTYTGGVLTSTGAGYGQASCNGSTNTNTGLAGTQSRLAILQLMYLWPTTNGPLGLNFVNQPNSNRLMVATAVFTIEGYGCAPGSTTC